MSFFLFNCWTSTTIRFLITYLILVSIYRQVTEKKTELIKREDVAVANDQRLVSIEREIARIKGKVTRI